MNFLDAFKVLPTLAKRIIFAVLGISVASAAAITSYDVHNVPQMYLNTSISATQTTGITISALSRNGTTVSFPTLSGGILRLRQGSKTEDIYFSTGAVNATTKVVTLYGVTRDLCWNVARTIQSCNSGLSFSKGAVVELTIPAQLLNLKANLDRANTFTASGGIMFSGSGMIYLPTFASEATRNHQISTTTSQVPISCITATGLCYYYLGGNWISFGSGAQANAMESLAGRVELATVAEQGSRTGDGTSGPLVLQAKYLTFSGAAHSINGTANAYRIPILNASGAISASLGGLGRINASSGSLLAGAGSGAVNLFAPATMSGKTLLSDGTRFVPYSPYRLLNVQTAASANLGASTTQEKNLYQFGFSGSFLRPGSVIQVKVPCRTKQGAGIPLLRVRIGAASGTIMVTEGNILNTSSNEIGCEITADITLRTVGAGGTAAGGIGWRQDTGAANEEALYNSSSTDISVNTTGVVYVTVTIQHTASNSNNYFNAQQAFATLLTPF